jgi:Domain of unknown function (DUF4383)
MKGLAMFQALGIFFGISFLLGGILGLVPGVTKDDMFFGIFMVNTPHNILHIASGTIFLIASLSGARAARLWFQTFGIFYAAVALIGFEVGNGLIFGLISNNRYDAWGHSGLALAMLLIGFAIPKRVAGARSIGNQARASYEK